VPILLAALLIGLLPGAAVAATPTAGPDSATVLEDALATTIDVLANDEDPDGDPITITDATDPAHGTVVVATDGLTLTYRPDANYAGPETFDYTITADGETDGATVSVTVTAVNDAPVAVDDPGAACGSLTDFGGSFPIPEDFYDDSAPAGFETWFTLIQPCDLLANDTDVDDAIDALTWAIDTQPANGEAMFVEDRMFAYRPDPDFSTRPGNVAGGTWASDSFTYRASDGEDDSETATMTFWIAPINDPPSFTPGLDVTVAEGSGAYSGAWATGISEGPATEAYQTVHFQIHDQPDNPIPESAFFAVDPAISADGTLTFTPASGIVGTYHLGVVAQDDGGLDDYDLGPFMPPPDDTSDMVDLYLTVTPAGVNADPVADDDTATVLEDAAPAAIPVLTGDTDADLDTLDITSATNPAKGTVVITGGGTGLTYEPDPNANGTDTFDYTLSDGNGGTDTGAVTVTITPVNDAPTFAAGPTGITVLEDAGTVTRTSWASGMSRGPTNEAGQSLVFLFTTNSNPGLFATQPSVIASSGTLSFKPAADASGTAVLTLKLKDNGGTASGGVDSSARVTVTIVVEPVNDAPVADDDSVTVAEDRATGIVVPVLTGDTDVEGSELLISAKTNGAKGTVVITGGGTGLTYKPLANKFGSDTFTYTVSDGEKTDTATVSVTITPANDTPNAVNDQKTVPEGAGATAVAVLANDTDVDGDTLTITGKTNGTKGTVAITGGGTGITYDPAALQSGTDTFTYTVNDGHGRTDTATVLVTITPDTAAPVLSGLTQALPSQILATNTANTVKVDLRWAGTDAGSGVASYQLQASVNGGTYATISLASATATTTQRTLTIGREYRFRIRATDGEGNVSAYRSWPALTPGRHQEDSSLASYVGTWTTVSSASKSAGKARYATATTARARFTFTGRDVGWVATRTSSSGRADVYLDGSKVATIDLDGATTEYRRMVFRWHFSTTGTHTVELRPLGDGRVEVDAFIVLR